jgi:hypothetical protein
MLGDLQLATPEAKRARKALDDILGVDMPQPGIVASLAANPGFAAHPDLPKDLVRAVDPARVPRPTAPATAAKPDDPLCESGDRPPAPVATLE